MNSYACAIVQIAYIQYETFNSHFYGILEIAILLERITIMNPFVKKHFTISSKKMILITFFPCLLYNSLYSLVFVPYNGGDFYYLDKNGKESVKSFWYVSTSDLANSPIGSKALIVFYFLRDVLTLITNIILSIVSLVEMKKYFNKKKSLLKKTKLPTISAGNQNQIANTTITTATNNNNPIVHTQNDKQKATEKNHIKLVMTICFISILIRVTCVASNVYYLLATDYLAILLGTIADLTLVLGPSVSFFVYYYFNRDFKIVFLNVVSKSGFVSDSNGTGGSKRNNF